MIGHDVEAIVRRLRRDPALEELWHVWPLLGDDVRRAILELAGIEDRKDSEEGAS